MLILSVNYLPMIYKYSMQMKCFYGEGCIECVRFLVFMPLYCQVRSRCDPWASYWGLLIHPQARGSLLPCRPCTKRICILGERLATHMAMVHEWICVLCSFADWFLPFWVAFLGSTREIPSYKGSFSFTSSGSNKLFKKKVWRAWLFFFPKE